MVYTLTGENDYQLNQRKHNITNEFVKSFGDLALEIIDAEDTELDKITEALTSLPFLASKKMVVLIKPSILTSFRDSIKDILAKITDDTELVIIEPRLDKRLSYYKVLKSNTNFEEFATLDNNQLIRFVKQEVEKATGKIEPGAINFLIDRVGTNQWLIDNEIKKLLLSSKNITKDRIEQLTESTIQSKVFDLLDHAFSGNHERALKIYDEQRLQKISIQEIMGLLIWQLHLMVLVRLAKNKTNYEIAKDLKVKPFVIEKTKRIVDGKNLTKLTDLVDGLLKIDLSSKTKEYNEDDALKLFIISM